MTELTNLQAKIDELAALRDEITVEAKVLQDMKEESDQLRWEILQELTQNKLKTLKGERLTVTRTEKPSIQIADPDRLMGWITAQGQDPRAYQTINTTMARGFVTEQFKSTGEIPPGVEITTSAYITLKENK